MVFFVLECFASLNNLVSLFCFFSLKLNKAKLTLCFASVGFVLLQSEFAGAPYWALL